MILSEIWHYPVKSCQGTLLKKATAQFEGLRMDRRYMLVDEQGLFLTQRQFPQLSQVQIELIQNDLYFEFAQNRYSLSITGFDVAVKVQVWRDQVEALATEENPALFSALSKLLGRTVRLVMLPTNNRPISDPSSEGFVSFADGLPYLLTTTASLADLNARLSRPVDMRHFRANLIINHNQAFAEDAWLRIKIGEVVFRNVKPCSRCVLTTVNPDTGIKSTDGEPLKTLAEYRQLSPGQIIFGVNCIAETEGTIYQDDPVEILEYL